MARLDDPSQTGPGRLMQKKQSILMSKQTPQNWKRCWNIRAVSEKCLLFWRMERSPWVTTVVP